ncbi:MAG: DUF465 domain-containing protein [Alphaproteobacteria bacterium]|nr:DUF465 domain-containing protein [Alphaproteobacteria bacterium]
MLNSHLKSLQDKHEKLEENIRCESIAASRNDGLIDQLKKEKLLIKEEIERARQGA